MRFRASIKDVNTFSKLAASLSSLGHVAWVRLTNDDVRFTIIPEQGTQVWAVLSIDNLFEEYTIQSAAENNTINLEAPLAPLQRALKSALSSISTSIRLTKKDNIPLLSLTITTTSSYTPAPAIPPRGTSSATQSQARPSDSTTFFDDDNAAGTSFDLSSHHRPPRDTLITQDIPVRVLTASSVAGLHEPRCREPDVHILLPPLLQLKAVSDRFTKLADAAKSSSASALSSSGGTTSTTFARRRGGGGGGGGASTQAAGLSSNNQRGPRLEMLANMHGGLRLSLRTDALRIASEWSELANPDLDPAAVEGAEEGVARHPSTVMRGRVPDAEGEEGWARVRIDGRDWGRVLSVGRLGGRVIACFCHELALILYVYLESEQEGGEDSVLTYYVQSYSA
ncbi:Hus1-like protein [Viridothelium virens]|uniref:Checkpoint protein n=1 Tax=Viridothelium virens TaxID=1048519 RepID=A0A6A6HJH4_VIRVR|nr:Hus1-like protein [Viridothelium virens]